MSTQSQMLPYHGRADPVMGNCKLLLVVGRKSSHAPEIDTGDVNSEQTAPVNPVVYFISSELLDSLISHLYLDDRTDSIAYTFCSYVF